MHARTWTARALALLLGTLALVLTAEAALQLAAALRPDHRTTSDAPARYTILCEGDSFTYGIGGISFPEQLEQILNERAGERLFRTVNVAVPGINTTLLVDDAAAHLHEHQPDVVIVTTGENNSWNAIRLSEPATPGPLALLRRHSRLARMLEVAAVGWSHPDFHDGAPTLAEIQREANHLVEYQEVVGLTEEEDTDWVDPPEGFTERHMQLDQEAWELEDQGDYEGAAERFAQLAEELPRSLLGPLGQAGALMRLGRYDEAIEVLRHALYDIEGGERTDEAFYQLGFSYNNRGRLDRAVETWTDGLRAFPRSGRLFHALADALFQQRRPVWEALEVAETVPEVRQNMLWRYLDRLSRTTEGYAISDVRDLISESFRADMETLAELGAARDVPMIWSSYPDHGYAEVAEVAAEHGIPFVDFRPVFAQRFERREDYLSDDGCHCNTQGYRIMAERFADEVVAVLGLDLPES